MTTRQVLLTALAIVSVLAAPARAQGPLGPARSAGELKVAFLINFMKFIEWPPQVFRDASAPFVLGIVGQDPFEQTLDDAVHDKTINGRHIRIVRLSPNDDLTPLHLLFVGASERTRVPNVLRRVGGASVLTVSDIEGFAGDGGVIELVIEGGRLRFNVNERAAHRSHLAISSKLLTLARIVNKD